MKGKYKFKNIPRNESVVTVWKQNKNKVHMKIKWNKKYVIIFKWK